MISIASSAILSTLVFYILPVNALLSLSLILCWNSQSINYRISIVPYLYWPRNLITYRRKFIEILTFFIKETQKFFIMTVRTITLKSNKKMNLKKKYGKSKEHRPNPIVGMGLFMDGDGFPLAFDIFPGNQNEQKSLKPLEHKVIQDFDCSEFIYCSDSGLASQNNKLFNDIGGRSYVITQSLKKLKKEDRDIALNTKQYRKVGSSTFIDLKDLDENDPEVYESIYYKEVPIESKKISETLIVTYSPKYKAYQEKIRQGQIDRAKNMISKNGKIKKNRKNPNDPSRFTKRTSITANGEVAEEEIYEIDQEAIDKEAMYDGFYAVSTDMEGDVAEIIAINKRRWQIEECFRIMKRILMHDQSICKEKTGSKRIS